MPRPARPNRNAPPAARPNRNAPPTARPNRNAPPAAPGPATGPTRSADWTADMPGRWSRIWRRSPSSPDDEGLPAWAFVALALWFTLLLSVWAGFLVPERVGSVPVPVWVVPLAAMLWLTWKASGRAGLWGALGPALVWLVLTWLLLGTRRAEGDLVVPATPAGYAYLFGGFIPWLVVVGRASAPRRRTGDPAPEAPRTQPGRPAGR